MPVRYGLEGPYASDGGPGFSLRETGAAFGVSGPRMWNLTNDAGSSCVSSRAVCNYARQRVPPLSRRERETVGYSATAWERVLRPARRERLASLKCPGSAWWLAGHA
jgi:hypothetical protein